MIGHDRAVVVLQQLVRVVCCIDGDSLTCAGLPYLDALQASGLLVLVCQALDALAQPAGHRA